MLQKNVALDDPHSFLEPCFSILRNHWRLVIFIWQYDQTAFSLLIMLNVQFLQQFVVALEADYSCVLLGRGSGQDGGWKEAEGSRGIPS